MDKFSKQTKIAMSDFLFITKMSPLTWLDFKHNFPLKINDLAVQFLKTLILSVLFCANGSFTPFAPRSITFFGYQEKFNKEGLLLIISSFLQ